MSDIYPIINDKALAKLPKVQPLNGVQYAYLVNEIGEIKYQFLFNPESKNFSTRANYSEGIPALSKVARQDYKNTAGLTLNLSNLLLESKSQGASIQYLLNEIRLLTQADVRKGQFAPPKVFFRWGSYSFGPAVITSLDWVETSWIGNEFEPASARLNMTLIEVPVQKIDSQKISKLAATTQSLSNREKAEAINKAKKYLQDNVKKLPNQIGQLVRANNLILVASPSGNIELLGKKQLKVADVGIYKNGKFTGNVKLLSSDILEFVSPF